MRSLDRADELALIERARRRDFDAFGRLVDAYQHRVFGFAKRFVKDREEAADITQEVFVRAFQNFDRFDARAPLRTWLFRIAYNLCVDKARRHERQPIE
ncbi:MAG: sigma-70 family RNA polymerase sigma factor, partial [Nitrospirae bacterium]|nr:sigma-70 family RNA polymerase sigma factor [Fimbriimonadaceae bacterium]